jgi:ribosomal-protein-alanine N-acetyltransferase
MQNKVETTRLFIEPLTTNDSHFIFELVNTEGWLTFIGNRNVTTQEDAVNYIQKILDNPNCTYYVFKLKGDNTPIGVVTLIKRDYLDHHDIGFAMLPQYSKNGYSFEASKYILDELARNKHTKILAITLSNNVSSKSLLEKLGLAFEKAISEDGEELLLYSKTLK